MALKSKSAPSVARLASRAAIKANVAMTIIIALALMVVVNVTFAMRPVRRDVAGSYGLSERTKSAVDAATGPIELSMVFPPDEENPQQQQRIDRTRDYLEELQRYAPGKIRFTHVATDSQRERLVARISEAFGGEADKHRAAIANFQRETAELGNELQARLAECQKLMDAESWLTDFPVFASVVATLKADLESLQKADQEIKDLTPAVGIPKFGDATRRAKEVLNEIKGHLTAVVSRLGELASLADETTRADSEHVRMLREVAAEAAAAVASLRSIIGDQDAPMPSDPAGPLKAFADRTMEVGATLERLVRRVDEFGRKFPAVRQHSSWSVSVQMGPLLTRMEVADVLQQAGQTLSKTRLAILGAIDARNPNELEQAVVSVRRNTAVLEQNASTCQKLLTEVADRLSRLDEGSRGLLNGARDKTLFKERLAAIDALDKEITALPELKLGSIADQLKQPNICIVEANKKIRTIGFNDLWPVRESVGGPMAKSDELPRTFNGDSAVASAIIALTREKPFATVVLTAFEPPVPPQQNQFMPRPPQSWVPLVNLGELRRRLEVANFKVVDWNLATTKERPKPEEGTEPVYLLLPPPPPSQANPFMQSSNEQKFGEAEREIIRKLLDEDARVLFLATWEVRGGGFFGGPPHTPPYGYAPLLEKDWGIIVDNAHRIVRVEPDHKNPGAFGVMARRFVHMPAPFFLDHEIGRPLRGTRFLISDACAMRTAKEMPEGLTVETVLRIPRREEYISANINDLIEIIDEVQNPSSEGVIKLVRPPARGPFDVMMVAQRKDQDKSRGKIVVVGFGGSFRDDYLQQHVLADSQTLRLDPPPTEVADVLVNSLFWLRDEPKWISRGPLPVPRIEPIQPAQLKLLRAVVWGIWPGAVFAIGIIQWYLRRT